MATKVKAAAARRAAFRFPMVDGFLWFIRIGLLLAILLGTIGTIRDGNLSAQQWRNLVVFGVAQGSVYALIALGYTMVYGVLRFINFAHGEVFMSGAMVGFFVLRALSETPLWTQAPIVAIMIAMLVCMTVSMVIAVLLERVAYRPLRGAPRLVPLITSIGASFFLQYAFRGLFGADTKVYPSVTALSGSLRFAGFQIIHRQLLVVVAAIVLMAGLYLFVEKTKKGKAIRAVSEDQEIARLMGINVDRTIMLVFAIGGAMAGAAGLLFGLVFGSVNFFSGFLPGIKAFTSAVLGGIGNIVGAMLGGLTLGAVESIGPSLVLDGLDVPASGQLKDMIAFLTLVLVLIFRPSGILGERLARERA